MIIKLLFSADNKGAVLVLLSAETGVVKDALEEIEQVHTHTHTLTHVHSEGEESVAAPTLL